MRSLVQGKAAPRESRSILSSLTRSSPPIQAPILNKRLQRGLKRLADEPGFVGLLQRDSCVLLDKLHLETEEESASSVSSSGSCGYLQPRFPQGQSLPYELELRRQVESKTHVELILQETPTVSFDDIAGNQYIKDLIRERQILPLLAPSLFEKGRGKPHSWSRVLLYGPPGVAKTLLAQAICSEVRGTCFWVSLADLTSKFIGESEKLLKLLFQTAENRSPSVIVFDEMDSLVRKRSGSESETERRVKTEFMRQMDSLSSEVLVVGTTNMPWELDIAALRRFERKVLVPMPEENTRKLIFKQHAGESHVLSEEDFEMLARMTEGYSGSDISVVCNEALLKPVRMLHSATHFKPVPRPHGYDSDCDVFWTPCKSTDPGAIRKPLTEIQPTYLLLRPADLTDFRTSIDNCKPTVSPNFVQMYSKFLAKFGHMEQEGAQREQRLSYFC